MQRQPDRQRDHHHRERIAAEHNTGHLVGLTLVLLAQDVFNTAGAAPPTASEWYPVRFEGQQPDGEPQGEAPANR
jgi:hypothetical protein